MAFGSGAPMGSCYDRKFYTDIDTGTTYVCIGTSWVQQSASSGPSAGTVQFRLNACDSGWTEQTDLADKTILVTTAAAMDAGTTGGSNTITPTIASLTAAAQSFTGTPFTSVINHTHTVNVNDPGHTHTQTVNSATTGPNSGYGVDTSTNNGVNSGYSTASATTGITATTANPAGGVSSITPAGTNSTSAVTGTLNQFDNRSAWVKMIGCVKD